MDSPIETVRACLDTAPAEALDAALAAWRRVPDPAIAAAVRLASTRALAGFVGPSARTREAFQAAWCDLARADPSPVATGWLLANLERLVPEVTERFDTFRPGGAGRKHAAWLERIALLSERCPDPRITEAALSILSEGRRGSWSGSMTGGLYQPVLAILEAASDDPSEALRQVAAFPRSKRTFVRQWASETLPGVADRIAAERVDLPTLPAEEAAAWAALCPGGEDRRRPIDTEALLREVLADPGDEAARAVLLDAWIETSDPRAELALLQRGAPSASSAKQIWLLLRAHERDWIGPDLKTTLQHTVYRDGLLAEAGLNRNAVASEAVWEAAAADARIATNRVLRMGKGCKKNYLRFLMSPHARGLERIAIAATGFVDQLVGGPLRPLRILDLARAPRLATMKKIAAAPIFEGVHTLTIERAFSLERFVGEVPRSGLHDRITALEIHDPYQRTGDGPILPRLSQLAEAMPSLSRLLIASGKTRHLLQRDARGWSLQLQTSEAGEQLVLIDQGKHQLLWVGSPTRPRLPKLSAAVHTLRILGPIHPQIASQLAAWKRTIVHVSP